MKQVHKQVVTRKIDSSYITVPFLSERKVLSLFLIRGIMRWKYQKINPLAVQHSGRSSFKCRSTPQYMDVITGDEHSKVSFLYSRSRQNIFLFSVQSLRIKSIIPRNLFPRLLQ